MFRFPINDVKANFVCEQCRVCFNVRFCGRDVTVHYREGRAERHTGQLYTKRREGHRPVLRKGGYKLG